MVGIWNGTLETSLHRRFVGGGGGSSLGDGSAIGSLLKSVKSWWRGLDLLSNRVTFFVFLFFLLSGS